MKYVIYKDYLSNQHHLGYDYIGTEAKNILEAIEQADQMYREENEKLYLIRIMENVGNIGKAKLDDGWHQETYKAILTKRSLLGGWHQNTEENGEFPHYAKRSYKRDKTTNGGYLECISATRDQVR